MKLWEKLFIITILFAIVLSSGIILGRQIDTQNKQKGTIKMGIVTSFDTTRSPQSIASLQYASGSIQGNMLPVQGATTGIQGNTLPVQGSSLNPNDYFVNPEPQAAPVVAPVDPYARFGGTAAYNALRSGFDSQKQNIYGSSNDAATNLQGGLGQSVLDTVRNFSRAQEGIDRKAVQNESSRIQGGNDILSMIGRGVRSGGVQLSQKNAGSSSAAQAIANAYAQLGQRQSSQIGNQYAQNADQIALEQRYQNEDLQAAPDKFRIQIEQNANQIATAARDQFAQLDAAMANASLPDRIAIEQEKENVRQQALAKLTQFDTQLRQGVSGIKAADRGANIAKANTQLTAGQADPNLFNYTTDTPTQFQGTGPFASELPIFTFNNRNKQQLA